MMGNKINPMNDLETSYSTENSSMDEMTSVIWDHRLTNETEKELKTGIAYGHLHRTK